MASTNEKLLEYFAKSGWNAPVRAVGHESRITAEALGARQAHRIKRVKRQMYGRAKFILLRRASYLMLLPWSPSRPKARLDLHENCGRTNFSRAPKAEAVTDAQLRGVSADWWSVAK
jgi:hypothetical protein